MKKNIFSLLLLTCIGLHSLSFSFNFDEMADKSVEFKKNNLELIEKEFPSWEIFRQFADENYYNLIFSPEGRRDSSEKMEIRRIIANPDQLAKKSPEDKAKSMLKEMEKTTPGTVTEILSSNELFAFYEINIPKEKESPFNKSVLVMLVQKDDSLFFLEYWKKGVKRFSKEDKKKIFDLFSNFELFGELNIT